jgi:hypothetical protein
MVAVGAVENALLKDGRAKALEKALFIMAAE